MSRSLIPDPCSESDWELPDNWRKASTSIALGAWSSHHPRFDAVAGNRRRSKTKSKCQLIYTTIPAMVGGV